MYFLEHLCDMAARENHHDYIRMIQRDVMRIVDAVAPDDGSGAANVKVVRKVHSFLGAFFKAYNIRFCKLSNQKVSSSVRPSTKSMKFSRNAILPPMPSDSPLLSLPMSTPQINPSLPTYLNVPTRSKSSKESRRIVNVTRELGRTYGLSQKLELLVQQAISTMNSISCGMRRAMLAKMTMSCIKRKRKRGKDVQRNGRRHSKKAMSRVCKDIGLGVWMISRHTRLALSWKYGCIEWRWS